MIHLQASFIRNFQRNTTQLIVPYFRKYFKLNFFKNIAKISLLDFGGFSVKTKSIKGVF